MLASWAKLKNSYSKFKVKTYYYYKTLFFKHIC